MTKNARAFRRLFTRKYLIGLFLLAGLACASLYIMYAQNARQAGRAELINLASGQTALSQRISFFANTLVMTKSLAERQVIRAELETAVAEMLRVHEILSSARPAVTGAPKRPGVINEIYFYGEAPFDADVRTFLDSAAQLAAAPDEALAADSILLKEVNLLGMHTIMQTHNVISHIIAYEAEREIIRSKIIQSVVTGLILLLLAGEAVFIFEPVGRAITDSIRKAEKSERLAQEEAKRANHAHDVKSNFLRVMSHEFRTPLNAVLGMTDLLKSTDLDDQQRVYLRHLHDAGHHMLLLANDILTVNQHMAGKLTLTTRAADLSEEIERVVGMLTPKAQEKGLALSFESSSGFDAAVVIDARRFRQVLINLIGNAIKFTDSGGIAIDARSAPTTASDDLIDVEIRVADTGVGVSADKQEKIFEEFEQAETFGERTGGGVGLGLAISRSIVEAIGGRLRLEASSAKGSTFLIEMRLPRAGDAAETAPAEAAPQNAGAAAGGAQATVLVADDNLPNRMIAAAYLKRAGYRVLLAENGADAIETCKDNPVVEMIFMDIEMPVMGGVAAARALRRADSPMRAAPIVALTAHALPEDCEKLRAVGFDDVLRKPIDEKTMTDCARRLIKSRAAA